MACLRGISLVASLLALSGGAAHADAYATARGLYRDCAAGVSQSAAPAAEAQLARCAGYLRQVLDGWNLEQDNGMCARYVGNDLPKAYVTYWSARGLGLIAGTFTSAERSAKEFLDSERMPCRVPDPKTHPP